MEKRKPGQLILEKDKAKIVGFFIRNPEMTLKEVAEATGVSIASVSRIREKELKHLYNDKIGDLIQKDIEIVDKGQDILLTILEDVKEGKLPVNISHIKSIVAALADSTKRHQLLTGGATENQAVAVRIINYGQKATSTGNDNRGGKTQFSNPDEVRLRDPIDEQRDEQGTETSVSGANE